MRGPIEKHKHFKEANSKDEEESTNLVQKCPRLGSERLTEIKETKLRILVRYRLDVIIFIYIYELSNDKWKFDPLKAQTLGLKPGPKYRDLQVGVTLFFQTVGLLWYVKCNDF